MTALDRQLAQTFRAARWAESGGQPVCHGCFDGLDLETPAPDARVLGLSRYRCRACYVEFSDARRTPYDVRKPTPLALWAYLTLCGDPRLLGWTEREVRSCFKLVKRIKGQSLAAAWRDEMSAVGIAIARVRRVLARQPEAA